MLDLIIGVLAALAAIIAAYWRGSRRGAQKAAQRDLKASQDVRKKEREVRDASNDDLVDRLTRNGM